MTSYRAVEDVFAIVLPGEYNPPAGLSPALPIHLLAELTSLAQAYVRQQYADSSIRVSGLMTSEWLITNRPDQIQQFQPAHDCEECRQGNAMTYQFLVENPDRYVVLANLHYTEIHPG